MGDVRARDNNFDFLRIAAALAVIIGHSFALRGNPSSIPIIGGLPIHVVGVDVFFVISGYLIMKSRLGRNTALQFSVNRVLRIFPALIAVVIASIVVLGILFSTLSNGQYFSEMGTWDYLWNILLRPAYALPGVFTDLPYPVAVNGSVWTLPAEFFCYVVVLIIGFLPRRLILPAVVALLLAASIGWLLLLRTGEPIVVWGTLLNEATRLWVFFAVGSLIAAFSRPGFFRLDIAVLASVLWLTLPSLRADPTVVSWALTPYIVLTFGLASTPVLRRSARYGDLSYGLYLYAFPVQQAVIATIGIIPGALNLVLVTGVTAALAVGSWHLIEKRAMALRFRIGGGRVSPVPTVVEDAPAQPTR
ncbi:acyltransferase family protein [Herbiconiux liukaitaii]|uniref:acyltransferase family protein n=1 Tax=Herbiconiux liukaitaii TaxID=3342799 RepID=UPI0035BA6B81